MIDFTHSQRQKMSILIVIGLVFANLIGACSPETQSNGVPTQTLPLATLAAYTETPEVTRDVTDVPVTVSPTAPSAAAALTCESDPTTSDVSYVIEATLDWVAHKIQAKEYVTFRNDTGEILTEVVFNIEANQDVDHFLLTRIMSSSGKMISRYTLEDTRLVVPLKEALKPGCETTFMLDYTLQIPEIQNGYNEGHLGYWGYSARQVNLGMWIPLIAAMDPDGAWSTPVSHWLGEHFVLRAADFTVDLAVKNAPENLRVAGPGKVSQPDDRVWRFEMANAREVAISLSDQFQTLQMSTEDDVLVELYYFSDSDADSLDTPRHALFSAADAMALYEELFGPYPYDRVVVVEGDFPDGMEFCGLVFVSKDWFQTWQGLPNDWLTIITAHEIAHQWWYALVGNDQAQYPYLDEALAIYSELLYFERYYPEYLDWWWDFRVMSYEPTGYVDTPIYDFYSPRGYIDAIYLRGARMMQLLRADVGDEQFMAWLRTYADHMRGHVAYPIDFWGVLSPEIYAKTEVTRTNYLKQPDLLVSPDQIP